MIGTCSIEAVDFEPCVSLSICERAVQGRGRESSNDAVGLTRSFGATTSSERIVTSRRPWRGPTNVS